MNRSKIIQLLIILAAITVIASGLSRLAQRNSMSLTEYADQGESQNKPLYGPAAGAIQANLPNDLKAENDRISPDENPSPDGSGSSFPDENSSPDGNSQTSSSLAGVLLNGDSQTDHRVEYQKGFYYEPLSDRLRRYITGISYPAETDSNDAAPAVSLDDLRYVHILHYDFEGNSVEGELICNASIAQDLVEIFYELHRNEYMLEKVLLIDEYNGDDNASMEDNNTSCFNYRVVEGTSKLSRHAYGLAVDVNPLYNPYITYEKDGTEIVSPAAALEYADRSARFAYKIDEDDLCCKLFTSHGFTWGGNWNQSKDYQHFQKPLP